MLFCQAARSKVKTGRGKYLLLSLELCLITHLGSSKERCVLSFHLNRLHLFPHASLSCLYALYQRPQKSIAWYHSIFRLSLESLFVCLFLCLFVCFLLSTSNFFCEDKPNLFWFCLENSLLISVLIWVLFFFRFFQQYVTLWRTLLVVNFVLYREIKLP